MAPEALADLYVRHAMALRDADRPPREWELGPAGRAAARELAAQLPRAVATALVVSSTEPKALATAAPIAERFGVEVVPDERLAEAHRPWVGSPNDYRSMAHRYLAGFATPGWEDGTAVVDRMAAAVQEARASVPGAADRGRRPRPRPSACTWPRCCRRASTPAASGRGSRSPTPGRSTAPTWSCPAAACRHAF